MVGGYASLVDGEVFVNGLPPSSELCEGTVECVRCFHREAFPAVLLFPFLHFAEHVRCQRNSFSKFVPVQLSWVSGLRAGRIPGSVPITTSASSSFGWGFVVVVVSWVIIRIASCCDRWLLWWWWWQHLACSFISLEEFESFPLGFEEFLLLGEESCRRGPPLSCWNLGKSFRYLCRGTYGLCPCGPQIGRYFLSGFLQSTRVGERSIDLGL